MERAGEILRQARRRRDRAGDAGFGALLRERRLADAETQARHLDAAFAQARADVVGEHRELVGPHARGDPQQQRAVLQGEGLRAIGDARADGVTPHAGVERRAGARVGEPGLARAIEDGLERLGFGQGLPSASPHALVVARGGAISE